MTVVLLGIEVWKQEVIPSFRVGDVRAEATCGQSTAPVALTPGGPNPTKQRSPWFSVVTFDLPTDQMTDPCTVVIQAPGLLRINPRNYYVKHVFSNDRTDLPNDNLDSGVLLLDQAAYTYEHSVLRIPARSMRKLDTRSRIELLVATSFSERFAYFRDAFRAYAADGQNAFVTTLVVMGLVIVVAAARRWRRNVPAR